jgi:hypothetical protein
MKWNISVIILIVIVAEVTFQNNVPNPPKILQLELLSCFLGF